MMATIRNAYHQQQFLPNWWGVFVNPFYLARAGLRDEILRFSSELSGELLDVGCGSKPYLSIVHAKSYIGLDIDSPAVRMRNVADYLYDGEEFPFSDCRFDSILCNQVFEHVFNPISFIGEMNRVLKPGGALVLSVPFVWDEHEQPFDYARYSTFGLRFLLERGGFEVIEQRKTLDNASVIFQMMNAYLYKVSLRLPKIIKLVITVSLMAVLNIFGVASKRLLPKNPDLFLDQVVLAKKRHEFI